MNPPQRSMNIIRLCIVVYGIFLIYLVFKLPVHPETLPTPTFELFVTSIALFDVVVGFYSRRVLRWIASRSPQRTPPPSPVRQWFAANILSLAFFISCMLFGLVLHFVGARPKLTYLLLGVGLASLIVWRPGIPSIENEGNPLQGRSE